MITTLLLAMAEVQFDTSLRFGSLAMMWLSIVDMIGEWYVVLGGAGTAAFLYLFQPHFSHRRYFFKVIALHLCL